MKATKPNRDLEPIPDCTITIPRTGGSHVVRLKVLPEITDAKSAHYNDEPVIGRSFPIKTYSHSENRTINMKAHFVILKDADAAENVQNLRAIQSAVYPREGASTPYLPPPVCKLKCGHLLSKSDLCVVLKSYSVNFQTDVAWYQSTSTAIYLPYKFDIDMVWEAVYASVDLPGQDKIFGDV
jgi:hypothetical protein